MPQEDTGVPGKNLQFHLIGWKKHSIVERRHFKRNVSLFSSSSPSHQISFVDISTGLSEYKYIKRLDNHYQAEKDHSFTSWHFYKQTNKQTRAVVKKRGGGVENRC